MSGFAIFGLAFFAAYWISGLMLGVRASQLRQSTPAASLPGTLSLLLGTAALGYLWSSRHRGAGDPTLTHLVFVTRITQLLLPVGAVILMSSVR